MSGVVNEVCNGGGSQGVKHIKKKQCLEGVVKTVIYATEDFELTRSEMDDLASWVAGQKEEKLYVMPNIEGIEDSSTEDKIKEGRYTTTILKKGVEGAKYRFDLSMCSYEAVQTIQNSKFVRVYELTDNEEATCDKQANGNFKGRKLTSLTIPLRKRTSDEDNPYVNMNHVFASNTYSIVKPKAKLEDLQGINEIEFIDVVISTDKKKVTFKAVSGCSAISVDNLKPADVSFKKADGTVQVLSALTFADGVYTGASATNLVEGTISTNGIVGEGDMLYKG